MPVGIALDPPNVARLVVGPPLPGVALPIVPYVWISFSLGKPFWASLGRAISPACKSRGFISWGVPEGVMPLGVVAAVAVVDTLSDLCKC